MSYPVTATGVSDFISFLEQKGSVSQNTAVGLRTGCDRIFSALSPDEMRNLVGLDVDAAVRRFTNKNPGVLSPASAAVYRSRIHRALNLLTRYNADPVGFKMVEPKKNGQSQPGSAAKAKSHTRARAQPEAPTTAAIPEQGVESSERRSSGTPVTGSVTLALPLRADFVAQFIVPRDLTTKEAKRLGAYFATVAIDYEPS